MRNGLVLMVAVASFALAADAASPTSGASHFPSNSWLNTFFVSFHRDPSQYLVLSDVSRFLHEGYGDASANVTGLVLADSSFNVEVGRLKGAPKDDPDFRFDVHAGAAETSL